MTDTATRSRMSWIVALVIGAALLAIVVVLASGRRGRRLLT